MSPHGILTHAQIDDLLAWQAITAAVPLQAIQRQPTSLDLRLGDEALVLRAGFLPAGAPVADQAEDLAVERLSLGAGAVLRQGRVHLVRLIEEFALPAELSARANPRSSTGRIDVFTRTVVDGHDRFDDIPAGYAGPLWLEVVPRSFDVRVKTGMRLNQARFFGGDPRLRDDELLRRAAADRLVLGDHDVPIQQASLLLGVSLRPDRPGAPVGWRARPDAPTLDLEAVGEHEPYDYFAPVQPDADGTLTLDPEAFYILASAQRLRVPPDLAAEMLAWDVGMGELRTNYAGFFDSGFGWNEHGARAVLEVRAHDVPFRLVHEQVLFRLQYSRTIEACEQLYGGAGSAYQNQGLALARYFRAPSAERGLA